MRMDEKIKVKIVKNRWIIVSFVLLIIIVDIWINNIQEINNKTSLKTLCSKTKATPSWFDWEGIRLGEGVIRVNDNTVNNLIKRKIYFVYSSKCEWCQLQIKLFGNKWSDYQKSGLTKNCYELNKND